MAKTVIDIDDKGQLDDAAEGQDVLVDLAQIHEPEVRQTDVGVREAGACQVDSLETKVLDDPGGERVGRPRQQHTLLVAQQCAQGLNM